MDPLLRIFGLLYEKCLIKCSNLNEKLLEDYVGEEGSHRLLKQGYALFVSSYIRDVWTAVDGSIVVVKACCYPTMKKSEPPRHLFFEMLQDENNSPYLDGYCSCKAGKGKCIHIIALVYQVLHWVSIGLKEIPEEGTCTSKEQQWHKPRGRKIESDPVMSVVFARPHKQRKRKPLTCSFTGLSNLPEVKDILKLKMNLKRSTSQTPLQYILMGSNHTTMVQTSVGEVLSGSTILHQLKNFTCVEPLETQEAPEQFPSLPLCRIDVSDLNVLQTLKLSVEEVCELEKKTRSQENSTWYNARRNRLTASKFGLICKRKKKVDDKFLLSLYEDKTINAKSIVYGKKNEEKARMMYIDFMKNQNKNVSVFSSGLIVNPGIPFLGCSPDGKVVDEAENPKFGLLEIKCPFSKQKMNIVDMCKDSKFYCHVHNGEIVLKDTSNEYYQIQGQMYLSGIEWCDFVIYNGTDVFVQRIKKNDVFCEDMLRTLSVFYENHWHEYITNVSSNC